MSILKIGPQHYRVFLHLGRDADGRQLRRSETVKGTRAEAERRERELRRALDTGTFVDPGAGTVGELMTRWLESIKDRKSERTYVRYEQMVRNQIVPDLGHIKLAQLRPLHIDAAEAKWATTGNRKTRKRGPLSPQSLLHLHRCLHTWLSSGPSSGACSHATRWTASRPPTCPVTRPTSSCPPADAGCQDQVHTRSRPGLPHAARLQGAVDRRPGQGRRLDTRHG